MANLSLVGILIVFGVLALIAGVIGLLKRLDGRWRAHERQVEAAAVNKAPNLDTITLLLITAAAATVVQGRFRVRRIHHLLSPQRKRTPWSAQGRLTLQGSHAVRRSRP
jgi:Na+-transporting methylmalonyl-CoA/oxaloacetate decarboxylase gamma subunit